jgi:hypothetical protein
MKGAIMEIVFLLLFIAFISGLIGVDEERENK